jgi:hypothetical protein
MRVIGFVRIRSLDEDRVHDIEHLQNKGERLAKEEQACSEAIHRIRHQDSQGPLKITNASIKVIENDEAFGRVATTEGALPWYRTWSSTMKSES